MCGIQNRKSSVAVKRRYRSDPNSQQTESAHLPFSPLYDNGLFYTRGPIIRPDGYASMAVFILRTHYPTGRTWANICSSSGYASQV